MNSPAFTKALRATAYLRPNGDPAPGLTRAGAEVTSRLRPLLSDNRVGLQADAVYCAQTVPTSIFKDAGHAAPTAAQIAHWHEAAWNVGVAPLLWIITPTDIRLYDCYASPPRESPQQVVGEPLEVFALDVDERLRALDSMCGRFATETGAFWSSPIGRKIDRRYRVDRELLREISTLEERLTLVPLTLVHSSPNTAKAIGPARGFAQRLIGRCIFTSYLIDRGIAQPFLPAAFPADVGEMFATVESTFRLFQWLRSTFNGDLFPMDDPGAEQKHLQDSHLELLRDFVEGRSLLSGQGRLFRFRYDAIPVDLISSIYQQFARSSAAENAHAQALHYTPVELVHLTLDPVLEALPATARVIDPTCGSGAFLVEAFRRLVWKSSQGQPVSRSIVRRVLYKQLYGIDINKSALGIAAFSLYLAALELDEEPVTNAGDLRFDRLIGTTLFQADTVHDELPRPVTERAFDAVIGNPPWTFVRQPSRRLRRQGDDKSTRPRRSPDQEFLWVAAQLAGETGRIGMVMKASPFFSKDPHAIEAREALLRKLTPAALVNLSALRKEQLFPDATGPALLFFARCALVEQENRLLVGSIPWTPDFRRNGIFHVGPGEFRSVPLDRVLRTPATLKAATFGSVRDGWLIEKLERSFPTLEKVLTVAGLNARGQGFQVSGDANKPPPEFYRLRVLTPEKYSPFRVDRSALPTFKYESLHRARNAAIFRGPVLLCPEGSFLNTTGRYSAAVSRDDLLYTESFYGVSLAEKNTELPYILNGILNSSLTTFQLAFGGSAWGLERTKVKPVDLLSLRVPDLSSTDSPALSALLDAERRISEDPASPEFLAALDRAVYEVYGLERDEALLADEAVARARMLLFEGREQRMAFVKTPTGSVLTAYAGEVVRTVNAYLRARGKRHLEAIVYPRRIRKGNMADGSPGVTAVRFAMVEGAVTNAPVVRQGGDADAERLTTLFHGQESADVPPYLNERRFLRIYRDSDLFVLKPSEVRYWTRTAGLNDADVILADHWIEGRNAPAA
jgi:hypothetical protein